MLKTHHDTLSWVKYFYPSKVSPFSNVMGQIWFSKLIFTQKKIDDQDITHDISKYDTLWCSNTNTQVNFRYMPNISKDMFKNLFFWFFHVIPNGYDKKCFKTKVGISKNIMPCLCKGMIMTIRHPPTSQNFWACLDT